MSFAIAIAGLHTVLSGFDWWFPIVGIAFATLAAAAIARGMTSRPWAPALAGFLAAGGMLTAMFAARSAYLVVIPSFASLATFGDLARAGVQSISEQSVPASVTAGIRFLLCLGVASTAVVADLVAVSWRRPALAAIPLAVILGIPATTGVLHSDVFVLLLAIVAWLVLLRAGEPFPQTARSFGLGAVAVIVAVLAPLALPAIDDSDADSNAMGGYLAGVNPVLRLGDDLRTTVPRTILTYSTSSNEPTYLRLVSLQNFAAESWRPDKPVIDRENRPENVGPPPGLAAAVRVTDETTEVDVGNLASPWLPVPYPATSVDGLAGDWFWNAADLTFTSPDRLARGEEFTARSLVVEPTPAQLSAAGRVIPDDFNQYLVLPTGIPPIIGTKARAVTASATSDYGKAVALQSFFRDGLFEYSETAPGEHGYDGTGMEVVAQFLQARSGYCIHFASAMAVMARTLGIPSRVAVGFLPGQKQPAAVDGVTRYRVTTRDVHSWPELYFEGIGWVRFEPTPGRGFVPSYADERTPGVPITQTPGPTPAPTASATNAPNPSDAPGTAGGGETNGSGQPAIAVWLWFALCGFAILALLVSPAIVRVFQRRIRMAKLVRGSPIAETGWREILHSADDLGVAISATATPREVAGTISASARLDDRGNAALEAVLERVEGESFARNFGGRSGSDVAESVAWLLRSLRRSARPRARIIAALVPPSMWRRVRGISRSE